MAGKEGGIMEIAIFILVLLNLLVTFAVYGTLQKDHKRIVDVLLTATNQTCALAKATEKLGDSFIIAKRAIDDAIDRIGERSIN